MIRKLEIYSEAILKLQRQAIQLTEAFDNRAEVRAPQPKNKP